MLLPDSSLVDMQRFKHVFKEFVKFATDDHVLLPHKFLDQCNLGNMMSRGEL